MSTFIDHADVLVDVTDTIRDTFILDQLAAHWPDQTFTLSNRNGGDIGLTWTDGPLVGPVTAVAESAARTLLGDPPAWPDWIHPHRSSSMLANALAIVDTWKNDRLVPRQDGTTILWSVFPDVVDVQAASADQIEFANAVCLMAGYAGDLHRSGYPSLAKFRQDVAAVLSTTGSSVATAGGFTL